MLRVDLDMIQVTMYQIEFCLISTPSNLIVPIYNVPQLNCALFKCPKSQLCLVPVTQIYIVLFSIIANLNCALIQ